MIIGSPPVPGTVPRQHLQQLRMQWLGLNARHFSESTISGQAGQAQRETTRSWSKDLRAVFLASRRVLKPQGHLLLMITDWAQQDHPVDAGQLLRRLARADDWAGGLGGLLSAAAAASLGKTGVRAQGTLDASAPLPTSASGEHPQSGGVSAGSARAGPVR